MRERGGGTGGERGGRGEEDREGEGRERGGGTGGRGEGEGEEEWRRGRKDKEG